MGLPRNIKDIKRFRDIAGTLLTIESGRILANEWKIAGISFRKKLKTETTRAVSFRKGLEKLGGSFNKLGQLLSLRPDLISEAYCDELVKLQDQVTPFPSSIAKKLIAEELKQPIGKLFKSFEARPLAAASIGQVHRATLHDGTRVVVKVQRPGIEEVFKTDIDVLSFIAKQWEKHADLQIVRPTQIVQEFEHYTRNEMDYVNEGRNIERFRENFKDDQEIIIPKVFWQYTTKHVLVMEEIVGNRIDRVLPKSRKERTALMDKVANMVFRQIFEHGIFHADPHPGNIFITSDGKIALLDFGIIGVFDEDLQISITDLFIAMIERDLKGMTHAMIKLGMVDTDTIDERLLQSDLRDYLGKYYGTELEVIKIGEVFTRLITISRKHKMVLPANFVLFGKALVTLEGLGGHIDPHWNFVECAQPYVKNLIRRRKGPRSIIHRTRRTIEKLKFFVEDLPDQANELMRDVKKADHYIALVHEDIESLTTEMNRSANRLVLGILMSGCIMGGALLVGSTEMTLFGLPIFPVIGFAAAMFLGLILVGSIAHEKRY